MKRKLKVKLRDSIKQISVGFCIRQHMFLEEYPEYDIGAICREAMDVQIKLKDNTFLKQDD